VSVAPNQNDRPGDLLTRPDDDLSRPNCPENSTRDEVTGASAELISVTFWIACEKIAYREDLP
jgi:hypothetical protein